MDVFLGLGPDQNELKLGLSVKFASVSQVAPPGKLSSNFPTFRWIQFQSAELDASGGWTGPTAAQTNFFKGKKKTKKTRRVEADHQ